MSCVSHSGVRLAPGGTAHLENLSCKLLLSAMLLSKAVNWLMEKRFCEDALKV